MYYFFFLPKITFYQQYSPVEVYTVDHAFGTMACVYGGNDVVEYCAYIVILNCAVTVTFISF